MLLSLIAMCNCYRNIGQSCIRETADERKKCHYSADCVNGVCQCERCKEPSTSKSDECVLPAGKCENSWRQCRWGFDGWDVECTKSTCTCSCKGGKTLWKNPDTRAYERGTCAHFKPTKYKGTHSNESSGGIAMIIPVVVVVVLIALTVVFVIRRRMAQRRMAGVPGGAAVVQTCPPGHPLQPMAGQGYPIQQPVPGQGYPPPQPMTGQGYPPQQPMTGQGYPPQQPMTGQGYPPPPGYPPPAYEPAYH